MFSDAMLLRQPSPANADVARLRRPADAATGEPAAGRPAAAEHQAASQPDGSRQPRRRPRQDEPPSAPSAPPPGSRRRATLADVQREFVSHPDNWPFLALAAAIAGWLLLSGPAWADAMWAALGLLLFIPQEYFTHVHLLHLPVPRTQRRYQAMYRLHYGHHDHPRRHDLMYMPLWLTLPMMAGNVLLLGAVSAASGAGARAFWAAFGGALAGYLVFEWSHLLCHVPFVPRGRLWRHMRTQHLLHHFSDETRGYSVAPWSLPMDRLLRTRAGDGRDPAARSPSCRYLGLSAGHPWIAPARQRFASRSSGDPTCSRLWLQAAASARSAHGAAGAAAAATADQE